MAMYKDLRHYSDSDADFIAKKILKLRSNLADQITRDRQPNSLIIGSWNIREFDSSKGGARLDEAYHYIAEIIDRFDICAVQEVRDDLKPLERLVRLLGPNWTYFVTDVTSGRKGNRERMAFIYNENRLFFRNLIGEVVLPENDLVNGLQFARTPFFAAFQASWFRFVLCTCHIYYGSDRGEKYEQRVAEISAIAEELSNRAKEEDEVYLLLGDMNIVTPEDDTMKALTDHNFDVPNFGATNLGGNKFYDQIAFASETRSVKLIRHGILDYRNEIFLEDEKDHYGAIANISPDDPGAPRWENWDRYYKTWVTHQMSDHLPIWVELEVDYSDDYLKRYVAD